MKTTISTLILCLALASSHSQVVTINSGNWTTSSIWSTGVVPGPADDVIIRHAVTVSNSSFAVTIRNLTLENGTLNATSTLSFNSGAATRNLHILNDLVVTATSNNNCRLTLQGANTSMDIEGEITLNRNHTDFVNAFGISLRDGSSLTGNDLTVNYMNSGDDNEEVFIRENSSMILTGDAALINTGGAEEPSLDVVDDSYFECNNLTASLVLPEAPSGVGRDVEIRVWNNGRMIVHGDLTLSRTGGRRISMTIGNSSPATASVLVEGNMHVEHLNGLNHTNKDLPVTIVDQCSLTIQGNLTAYSNSVRALNFNFTGTSQLDVDGVVTLTGTTNNNLTMNANGNSRFFFGGDIVMSFPTLPNANLFFFSSATPNISTITFDGNSNQTVPGLETYGNLVISNSSHVTLAGNITVTTSLAMNSGKMKAASRVVTLPLGASITGSSNAYICNGMLSRGLAAGAGPYWFYVGDTTKGYSPVVLSNLSATSTFEVKYFPEYAGNAPSPGPYPVNIKEAILDKVTHLEYWMIDRVVGTGSAQVSLGWNVNSGMSDIYLDRLRVSRWNGSQWTDLGTTTYTGDVSAGVLKTDGAVTNFSPFTFGSTVVNNFIPLAVSSLPDFTVQQKNDHVEVSWQSTERTAEAEFIIERSSDGRNFEVLGTISANNNSGGSVHYTFTDHYPLPCKAYYRLQQNNINGNTVFSKTVRIDGLSGQLKLFPNPVILQSSANLQIVLPECRKQISFLQIFSTDGKEVYKVKISAGSQIISLPLDQLRLLTGIYKVVLSYENKVASAGFILQ
jgi:hypothetical protein